MRVLLYSRAFPPDVGGVERFGETLAGSLAERGHDLCVVTRSELDGPEPDRDYQVVRGASPDRIARLARGAHVVHANGLSLRGVGIGIAARRPTVVTHQGHQSVCPTGLCLPEFGECDAGAGRGVCSGCPGRGWKGTVDVGIHRRAAGEARANVAVSEYLRRRIVLPRSSTVYSPVRPDAFAGAVDDGGVDGSICFAGRLVEEKGVELLLRAVARVPHARLEIVGDGPMRSALTGLADDLGLSLRVSFLGALPFAALADSYARAAVVCVPTICEEAFGFAAAEAMAMRRPLVVTPSGALRELCSEGRGFIADRSDVGSLAGALARSLEDVAARDEAATRAHAFAHVRLTAHAATDAYLDVYEGVAA